MLGGYSNESLSGLVQRYEFLASLRIWAVMQIDPSLQQVPRAPDRSQAGFYAKPILQDMEFSALCRHQGLREGPVGVIIGLTEIPLW